VNNGDTVLGFQEWCQHKKEEGDESGAGAGRGIAFGMLLASSWHSNLINEKGDAK
jgi:hypothetical protein